jgi:hypothetical protein
MWPRDRLLRAPASLDASFKHLLVLSSFYSINVSMAMATRHFEELETNEDQLSEWKLRNISRTMQTSWAVGDSQ